MFTHASKVTYKTKINLAGIYKIRVETTHIRRQKQNYPDERTRPLVIYLLEEPADHFVTRQE